MDKSTLDQANSLINTIEILNNLNKIMNSPYPYFSNSSITVNSAFFDEETLLILKSTIKGFIEKRKNELQEKFESL